MSISASMVKELREKTSAGMMDCKKALDENDGDMEKAVDWLRQKGLSKAAKKAGRTTSEGLIGFEVTPDGKSAVLVEIKCETDFVARGDKFQNFVKAITAQIVDHCPADEAALLAEPALADKSRTVQDILHDAIATIGENIVIGRFLKRDLTAGTNGMIGSYLHSNSKIAVLVELKAENATTVASEAFHELAKNVAMQIAAASPLSISPDTLDPAQMEREREVYRQKARDEGKPENIVEKIAEGAVKKYYKEVCLLEQPYIRDDKMTVGDLIKATGKTLGESISVVRFDRVQLGAE
ncbi:MAG: translation elongation factor Ts [Bilophila sp.]